MSKVQNVFLVGAKSLGAYGGYETFVYKLTEYHQNNPNIKYHVACKANGDGCMDETKLDNVKSQIVWKRCMDMNDRVLRNIVVGLGSKMPSTTILTSFVASSIV